MAALFGHLRSTGEIFALVRESSAVSRSEIARLTGLAPSTVTLRVDDLIRCGYLTESGEAASRGGRRPRVLAVARDVRRVAGVDIGGRHATIVVYDLGGVSLGERSLALDIAQGPEVVLRQVCDEITGLVDGGDAAGELVGVGLALPGPVGIDGRVISPSRMPGWNGVDPAAILSGMCGVQVRAENDANALAFGEFVAGGRIARHMIVLKAGSSIGTGIVADGSLYRGSRGMAGDVSHTAVSGGPAVVCSCGRLGCLDAVAGGRAIVLALNAAGIAATSVADVAQLALDAHPVATRLLREAGQRTGAVLATLVSFVNPQRLALAGSLSSVDVFVAAVRSSVYDLCLPLSTHGLEISQAAAGRSAGALGAASLLLDEMLSAAAVDEAVRVKLNS